MIGILSIFASRLVQTHVGFADGLVTCLLGMLLDNGIQEDDTKRM
jgi:hypothetical protein